MGRRDRDRGGYDQRVQALPVDAQAVQDIIIRGNAERLIDVAYALGENLVAIDLKTRQIRNIFGTARRLQADWLTKDKRQQARRQLILLKPKLAYQAKRMPPVAALQGWIVTCIDSVIAAPTTDDEDVRFMHFMDFFEAILAYHTYHGGKQD